MNINDSLPHILSIKFAAIDAKDNQRHSYATKEPLDKYTYKDSIMPFKLLTSDLLEMGGRVYRLFNTNSIEDRSNEINYYVGNSGDGMLKYHYYLEILNTRPQYGKFVSVPILRVDNYHEKYETHKRLFLTYHLRDNYGLSYLREYCELIGAEYIAGIRAPDGNEYHSIIFSNLCFIANVRDYSIWINSHNFTTFTKFDRYLLTISVDYETYINIKTQALDKLTALEKHNSDLRTHIAQLEKNADMLRDHHESIISATLADEYLCAEYYKKQADKTLDEYCVICMNAVAEYLIVPCGHLAYCEKCCEKIDTCAICRGGKSCAVKVHKIAN